MYPIFSMKNISKICIVKNCKNIIIAINNNKNNLNVIHNLNVLL